EGHCSWSGGLLAAAFAVTGMFSGEQNFLLLWAVAPLAGLCFSRRFWRMAIPVWAALGAVGGFYLLAINRLPVWHAGFGQRYERSWSQIGISAGWIGDELWGLTGFPSDAPFRVSLDGRMAIWAVGVAIVVGWLVWKGQTEAGPGAGRGP